MIRARINVAEHAITVTMIASLEIVDKSSWHTVLYIAPQPLIEH
jgi:hypothetical protein